MKEQVIHNVHKVTNETGIFERHLIPQGDEDNHTVDRYCQCYPTPHGVTVENEVVFLHKNCYTKDPQ